MRAGLALFEQGPAGGAPAAGSCEEILRLAEEVRDRSTGSVGVGEYLSSVCNDLGDISCDLGDLNAAVRFCGTSRELNAL